MFSFESPHRCDSNEYSRYTVFNIKEENRPKLSKICSNEVFSQELQNKFEPGRLVQSVGHLTRESEVQSSIPGLATYFPFSFR